VNSHYNSDSDLQDMHEPGGGDREISLGTSTILGIFFALALICAVFFGFGYTLGRRSAQPPAGTAEPATGTGFNNSKPARGSLVSSPDKEAASATPVATPVSTPITSDATTATTPDAQPDSSTDLSAKPATRPVSISRVAAPPAMSAPTATPGAASSVVQVAAVSHQEDADLLLSALKKRGYNVAVRQEPQDKLLHVQLGPFATKKDADAMRQRLLADGYNAIVK
jgi:DedD protein